MGRKSKYTAEQKTQACMDYLSGKKSAMNIAIELQMGKGGRNHIREWAKQYQINGSKSFENKSTNNYYSKEFKERIVKEYLQGRSSLPDICIKYNLPSASTPLSWIKKYNSHIELKDYDPKPEVYMADTLKTTLEERLEIVQYCLDHDRDIKGTALLYKCKYAQLYQWIRKYEKHGKEGLIDKRGKRKEEVELTALEKANRKIAQLEKEKEEFRKRYELLKKAEERERW